MPATASEFSEGTQIGDWTISSGKPLGRGGQGAVWSVKPAATKRTPPRALKACFSPDEKDRARFMREIELMSRCDSPYVPRIFASDATWLDRVAGVPPFAFYVTEKYEGSLHEREKDLGTTAQRLALFHDACRSVSYLHTLPEPIIHRDIKPPNFLLAKEHRRLVLGDFGIARELVPSLLTAAHEVVGTELFRAPEVARGGEGSVQSDVYSLGRVLEWLLTYEVSKSMGTRKVPRGGDLSDEACDVLDRILVKATQPHAAERFASVRELMDQLPELWLVPKPRAVVDISVAEDDAAAVWHAGLDLARANDQIRWRQLELQVRRALPDSTRRWRASCDAKLRGADAKQVSLMIDQLLDAVAPRFALALAGVYSQHATLSDQRRLVEELTTIPDWNRGGYTMLAAAPRGLVYLFQYVHGAVCCEMGRMDLAMQMADTNVQAGAGPEKTQSIWRHPDLVTWPELFGGDSIVAWEHLMGMPEKLSLLDEIFALRRDYSVGVATYSMLLSLLEAAHRGSNIIEDMRAGRTSGAALEVMPLFWKAPIDIVRAAFARTFGSHDVVQLAADRANVDHGVLNELWPTWRKELLAWRKQIVRVSPFQAEDAVLGDIA